MRGSVIKRVSKDGRRTTYAIKYRTPDGSQKWETIGSSKKDAQRVLAQRLHELNVGTFRELTSITFGDFAEKWLADYAESRVKPSTYDGYRRYLEGHWIPAFGQFPLQSLTTGQVQEFVSRKLADGLSPKTVNNLLVPVKLMLRHAVSWGYLASNPAADVERPRVEQQEMQALTSEQVRRLLAAVDPDAWLLIATAVFTGLRRGELLALQWADIDWTEARLHVRRSLWRGQFVGPKTKRAIRAVDLAPQVLDALRDAKPHRPDAEIAGQLIFSSANGTPIEPDNFVKRRFLPALERAELPRIRFHDLRHTYASLLIQSSEHPKYIQQSLGHASIVTTLDRYGHLLPGAYAHGGQRIERTVLGEGRLPRP